MLHLGRAAFSEMNFFCEKSRWASFKSKERRTRWSYGIPEFGGSQVGARPVLRAGESVS
jgi:hypothetical protein